MYRWLLFLYFTSFDSLAYCFGFSTTSPPPKQKKNSPDLDSLSKFTYRELKIRVVGFVLKKLLTYFEMLIVPHALHCIDGCFKIRVVGFVLKKLLTYFEMLIVLHALHCIGGCFIVFYLI